jgi:dipeptidyl-peptidase-4
MVDGKPLGSLKSVAEEPNLVPKFELTRIGEKQFNAAIVRPREFSSSKKYPVVVSVYGGPHGIVVSSARDAYLDEQWLADQGFIIVKIDGRGTPGRGREWERATSKNFIDKPLDDQIEALTALGKDHPEMDLSRVGITGWSFGGYFTAMATMRRPDVFKCGVAGAPVADFADYDTHYTERYLGLPDQNTEGYQACSVLTWAKDLSVPLLLIHGTADDNVYFMHSLKICDALTRAGKTFDFMPLAGFTHSVRDPAVIIATHKRTVEFFKQHLGEPK